MQASKNHWKWNEENFNTLTTKTFSNCFYIESFVMEFLTGLEKILIKLTVCEPHRTSVADRYNETETVKKISSWDTCICNQYCKFPYLFRERAGSLHCFYIPEFKRPWRKNVFSSSFCFVVEIFGKWVGCCLLLETLVIHVVQSLWMSMYNVPHKINFKVVL